MFVIRDSRNSSLSLHNSHPHECVDWFRQVMLWPHVWTMTATTVSKVAWEKENHNFIASIRLWFESEFIWIRSIVKTNLAKVIFEVIVPKWSEILFWFWIFGWIRPTLFFLVAIFFFFFFCSDETPRILCENWHRNWITKMKELRTNRNCRVQNEVNWWSRPFAHK